ncbi:MAG: LIC_13387 family protein [Lysobacter sp.]
MLPHLLIAAGAAIALVLGTIHLVYTFVSRKFSPRDTALEDHMKRVSPVITRQTTLWKPWVASMPATVWPR